LDNHEKEVMVYQKTTNMNNLLRCNFKVFYCASLIAIFFNTLSVQAATQAEIDAMRATSLAWLITNQKFDGSWQGVEGSGIQTTSIALDALNNAGINSQVYARGLAWLANAEPQSVDSLSRQIVAMANAGMDVSDKLTTILSWRNNTFTWGAYDRYTISYPDTPLASSAIRTDTALFNANIAEMSNAMCSIIATQKTGDVSIAGSWSYFPGPNGPSVPASPGSVIPTVYNLIELSAFNDISPSINCGTLYQFIDIINAGLDWLISQRLNIDGGFGDNGTSTALETALAYSMIAKIRPGDATLTSAQDFMVSTQSIDGSWQGDTLVAAIVATTLPTVTLVDTDNDGIPDSVEAILGTNPAIADSRDLLPSDGIFTYQDYQNSNMQPNGDINGDGIVNIVDILLAQRAILGSLVLTPEQQLRGDVAPLIGGIPVPNGVLNAGDLLLIQRKALGIVNY